MKRLYLDVDGVLLGKTAGAHLLAPHAADFLEFSLAHFDCFWCTPHCNGDSRQVMEYLRPFTPPDLSRMLMKIKPTRFDVLKTESLAGDFFWIDDSPLAAEISDLCRRGALDRWIEINTRVRRDDLLRAMELLTRALNREPAPPRIPTVTHRTDFRHWAASN